MAVRSGGAGAAGSRGRVGAGTGYYLRAASMPSGPNGHRLDISKYAARRAAKAHLESERSSATLAGLPLKSGAAAVVLDVFAPRNAAEAQRALHPNGALVVVTPTMRTSANRERSVWSQWTRRRRAVSTPHCRVDFARVDCREVEERRCHCRRIRRGLGVSMGPSTRHARRTICATRIRRLREPMAVTLGTGRDLPPVSVRAQRASGDRRGCVAGSRRLRGARKRGQLQGVMPERTGAMERRSGRQTSSMRSFEYAEVGIAVLDSPSRIRRANETLGRYLGWAPAELVGCDLFDASPPRSARWREVLSMRSRAGPAFERAAIHPKRW